MKSLLKEETSRFCLWRYKNKISSVLTYTMQWKIIERFELRFQKCYQISAKLGSGQKISPKNRPGPKKLWPEPKRANFLVNTGQNMPKKLTNFQMSHFSRWIGFRIQCIYMLINTTMEYKLTRSVNMETIL